MPRKNKLGHIILSLQTLMCSLLLFATGSFDYETLKAVYLERLSRFVEWPAAVETNIPSSEFVIAVLGQDPFIPQLKKIFALQLIRGKKVRIILLTDFKKIPPCQILFIAVSETQCLLKIVTLVKHRPILTVADTPGFAESGVQINLYRVENKIRFEINEQAVRDAGIQIGYQLLSYARIVNPVKEGDS